MLQCPGDATQFRQALHAADSGVAGLGGGAAQVVENVLAVVGAHGDTVASAATLLFIEQRVDQADPIVVAAQVIRLVKGAIRFAFYIAQMDKENCRAKGFHHSHQIIVAARAVGASAHG